MICERSDPGAVLELGVEEMLKRHAFLYSWSCEAGCERRVAASPRERT
jgi:hypothetical protein